MTNDLYFEIARANFGYVAGAELAKRDAEVLTLAEWLRENPVLRALVAERDDYKARCERVARTF